MTLRYSTGTTLDPDIEKRLRSFLKGQDNHKVKLEIAKALMALKKPEKGKDGASSASTKQNVLEVCLGVYAERTKKDLAGILNELVNDKDFSSHADISPLRELREKIQSGVTWETLDKQKVAKSSGTAKAKPASSDSKLQSR